ncbi:MAG: FAD-binding protein [Sphingobacteriaceae bacterium]|nr:FAD-binding protein [Sphingobacteriaceae bacterium]
MIPKYSPITAEFISQLKNLLGEAFVLTQQDELARYAQDETEDLTYFPELVVKPHSAKEISQLLIWCNQYKVPLTPRGAGTGLSGAALPIYGGVLLSMERFNSILEIDEQNLQARVQSGVITEVFMNAVEEKGLYYPVDPSSKGSCFLGGNVAHGSGGPRVVKYGTIREYILNLKVVLPTGEIIWTGANTLKFASGYNLTQLFIGSEGTLGIVTEIVVKLIPKPAQNVLLLASFTSNEQACEAVSAIFRAGITPSAVEFMERKGVEWVMKNDGVVFDLKDNVAALLLIELDGPSLDALYEIGGQLNEVLENYQCLDVLFADTATQKVELWRMRRTMAVSVKANSVYKEEDTVVPRAALPQLIAGIKRIGLAYGFESICYGHAGDGNLHVNILKGSMSDEDWQHKLKKGIAEIFEFTVSLGGTLSGEHGIGLVQKEYMHLKFSEVHLNLMRHIKQVFDPQDILNPGKIF